MIIVILFVVLAFGSMNTVIQGKLVVAVADENPCLPPCYPDACGLGICTTTIVVPPQPTMIGTLVGINGTYANSILSQSIVSIAIVVVNNAAGQTVAFFAGTFVIPVNGSSTVYVAFWPPPPHQSYFVEVYLITPQGGVISPSHSFNMTL